MEQKHCHICGTKLIGPNAWGDDKEYWCPDCKKGFPARYIELLSKEHVGTIGMVDPED